VKLPVTSAAKRNTFSSFVNHFDMLAGASEDAEQQPESFSEWLELNGDSVEE
jgi:hypothetical protein